MGIRFDMVGLFVGDLPKMVAFYRDVLGVEIEGDELRLRGSVPASILPARARLHYRGADFEIQWTTGRSASASLDGKRLTLEGGYFRPKLVPEPERTYQLEITTTKT